MAWHSSGSLPVVGGLQAPVNNGGELPVGHAVTATSVRNPTAAPGKAAFVQFDKLTAGKAQTRKAMPHGNPVEVLPTSPKTTWSKKFDRQFCDSVKNRHSSGSLPVAGGLQARVSNGGALPVGRAVAATPVRNPTVVPGKAAFDQFGRFDKLTAGKAHGRQSSGQESHVPRGIPWKSSLHH